MAVNAAGEFARLGLIELLRADADVAALVGSVTIGGTSTVKVFDGVPHQQSGLGALEPWVEVGEGDQRVIDVGCGRVFDVTLQVHCWPVETGRRQAERLNAAVLAVLEKIDLGTLTLPGAAFRLDRYDPGETTARVFDDEDGRHRHGVISLTLGLAPTT